MGAEWGSACHTPAGSCGALSLVPSGRIVKRVRENDLFSVFYLKLLKISKRRQTVLFGRTQRRVCFGFELFANDQVHLGNFSKIRYCVISPVMNEPEDLKILTS